LLYQINLLSSNRKKHTSVPRSQAPNMRFKENQTGAPTVCDRGLGFWGGRGEGYGKAPRLFWPTDKATRTKPPVAIQVSSGKIFPRQKGEEQSLCLHLQSTKVGKLKCPFPNDSFQSLQRSAVSLKLVLKNLFEVGALLSHYNCCSFSCYGFLLCSVISNQTQPKSK
jgi:hypothetical protein